MAKMIGTITRHKFGMCPYGCCTDFNPKNKKDRKLYRRIARSQERQQLDRQLRSMVD